MRKENSKGFECLGVCYDVLAQVISILDVVTDIIVCVQYYQKDRMVFFGISITILLLALIAYDFVFMINLSEERKLGRLWLFLTMLPISPLIPFILYFTANSGSKAAIWFKDMCCFKIRLKIRHTSKDKSKLRQFMENKMRKHLGFIVEALVEGMSLYSLPGINLLSLHNVQYI